MSNNEPDLTAEKACIASMLLNETAASIAVNKLEPDDFIDIKYRLIFEISCKLFENTIQINRVNLLTAAQKMGKEGLITAQYMAEITREYPNIIDIDTYIGIVKREGIKRRLLMLYGTSLSELSRKGCDGSVNALEMIEEINKILTNEKDDKTWVQSLDDSVNGLWADMSKNIEKYPAWHYPDITVITDVMPGYKLIVVAGGTGSGKSTFMAKNAIHMVEKNNTPVLFISLEMSKMEIGRRIARYEIGIDPRYLSQKSEQDNKKYIQFKEKYEKYPLIIVDDCIELSGIIRTIRLHWMQSGVRVVYIDYLGLIKTKTEKGVNNAERIGRITGELKQLAMQLKIDIVLGCQFNRSPMIEKSEPKLHQLRDSGSIEQDADLVIILDRLASRDPTQRNESLGQENMSIIVAKNRDGRTGRVKAIWHDRTGTIENEKYLTKS